MDYQQYHAKTRLGKIMEHEPFQGLDDEMVYLEKLVRSRDKHGKAKFYDENLHEVVTVSPKELEDCINVQRKRITNVLYSFMDTATQ